MHLEADVYEVVQWANTNHVLWAFTDRNAGTRYASFYKDLNQLIQVDWNAVAATDFRESLIKEGKQSEFLVYESFPWFLIRKVGTLDQAMVSQVRIALQAASHLPVVSVETGWYY